MGTRGQKTQVEPRRRPRQARSQVTVDAILEAAAQLFAKEGFEETNTTRIAERAGVSVGSLYEYFPNKEALVAKLLKRHCDQMIDRFALRFDAAHGQHLEGVVSTFVDATYEAYAVNVKLHRVLLEQMGRVSKPRHLKRVSFAIVDLLEQALVNCGTPVRGTGQRLAAFMVESTVEALIHRAILYDTDLFLGELRSELKLMVLGYLRPGTNRRP